MEPDRERIIVTVDEPHLPKIQSVAESLRAAGMDVTNVMPTVGIIAGHVSSENKNGLAIIPGVASVEPDQEMHAI